MAALGLSYDMQDLQLQHADSLLWHVGSSSQPEIEPGLSALGARNLLHWTTSEVPRKLLTFLAGQRQLY